MNEHTRTRIEAIAESMAYLRNSAKNLHKRNRKKLKLALGTMCKEAQLEPLGIPEAVCCVNLVMDCLAGRITADAAEYCLREGSSGLHDTGLRSGEQIDIARDPTRDTCTVILWPDFCEYCLPSYGVSRFDSLAKEEFWHNINNAPITHPVADLHLTSSTGNVWFTDYKIMTKKARNSSGIDPTAVYDILALDWTRRWETYGRNHASARAVALCCHLYKRSTATDGAKRPTARDGWGHFLFVPRATKKRPVWPVWAGLTINPMTGHNGCPEGVHGPLTVSGEEARVVAIGEVVRVGDGSRLVECGESILRNAQRRLRRQ